MNILEAVELMKIGKQVRRSSWTNGCRVSLTLGKANYNKVSGSTLFGVPVSFFEAGEGQMTIMPSVYLLQGDTIQSQVQILIEDVIANDWEIYQG